MRLLVFILVATGCASAHHNEYHQSSPLSFHSEPQHVAYAVPLQIYSANLAPAPTAEIYTAASPGIYTAPGPQIYTASIAPAPQVYAAVTPAPQYAVHDVEVQTYSAPSYSTHSYSVPSYSAQSYSAPSYSAHSYSSAPAIHTTQYKAPVKSYSKTSYSSSPNVKTYSALSKSSFISPVKFFNTPQYSAVQYESPAIQRQPPTPAYHTSAINQYSSGAYVKPVAILRQSQDDNFDGSFSYEFQAENGITSSASGYVKQLSPKEQAQVIQGQYSYTAPDGTPVLTRWFADETGFHAEGSHLPVSPPVPEAIAKSLAYQGVLN